MKHILEVKQVTKKFVKSLDKTAKFVNYFGGSYKEEVVHAVDDVSFNIQSGEVVGVVGESGCGKSTLGRMIAGIMPLTKGSIAFKEKHYVGYVNDKYQQDHAIDLKIQMIFQDPFSSLNPRKKVVDIISEAPIHHQIISNKDKKSFVAEILNKVGLNIDAMNRYPHQFSGGMRQRAMIAMPLSCNPRLLIAHEPTTALDVTIQAQILELMKKLQKDLGMAIMVITHDLGVIAEMADQVAVMYMGKVVETGDVRTIFNRPLHPYTVGLMRSIPKMGHDIKERLTPIPGSVPDPFSIPQGCAFYPRCPAPKKTSCQQEVPLQEVEPGHWVRCTLY